MRMITFNFLRNCKLKTYYYNFSRNLSKEPILAEGNSLKALGDPSLVEIGPSWSPEEEPELQAAALRDMRVLPDFVSEEEEASILSELDPYLKKMRYEFDHWDNAIQGYRETERSQWRAENEAIIRRVKETAFPDCAPLPHAHVLDLAPGGHIKPHVDALRFCGDTIAGLCLASSAVMVLQHSDAPHRTLRALLQRRALYIMSGVSRYQFTHAVLGTGAVAEGEGEGSWWRGVRIPRLRRVAVICRSPPAPAPTRA